MLAIGSDHGGYELKQIIIDSLKALDVEFYDVGCYSMESVDYPDIALKVAAGISSGEFDRGILICGTGIGISIAANKVPGIRAALCSDTFSARMCREHNDSNILVMGGRTLGPSIAVDILETWLNTEFVKGRHAVRVGKISDIEKKYLQTED